MIKTLRFLSISVILSLLVCACSWFSSKKDGPPKKDIDVSKIQSPTPHALARSSRGNPSSYVVNGKRYFVLKSAKGYVKRGLGSWYGRKFDGQLTSSGEPYDMLALTAASPDLPIPVYAQVTNLENGRSIIVKVNDRGPFVKSRIMDLSYAAAKKLGYANKGTARIEVRAITFDKKKQALSHYLQVASFRNKQNALALKSQLTPWVRQPISIQRLTQQHYPVYRVQIGPIASKAKSARLAARLKSWGMHPIEQLG